MRASSSRACARCALSPPLSAFASSSAARSRRVARARSVPETSWCNSQERAKGCARVCVQLGDVCVCVCGGGGVLLGVQVDCLERGLRKSLVELLALLPALPERPCDLLKLTHTHRRWRGRVKCGILRHISPAASSRSRGAALSAAAGSRRADARRAFDIAYARSMERLNALNAFWCSSSFSDNLFS